MANPLATPVAIAVLLRDDDVLIGQRGAGVALAGRWEFPGGKIEPGETPAEAAVRECHEETGLDVRAVDPMDVVRHTYDHGTVELHFIQCEPCRGGDEPSAPFRWVKRHALGDYEFPSANTAIVDRLIHG